ncbi:MAG TPA: SRPBCC family protein [Anaeromyxobacteraceae bacterium]|nr:SRPBCC family protein [Anaeromyxobacteraceae bacterium]
MTREIRIAAPIDRVWDVIVDYPRYPEFVPGVLSCRVVGSAGGARHVEYEVDLAVRRVRYVLAHREERPTRVAWSLVRGDLLARSDGAWDLAADRDGTLARYTVDVLIARPPLVPGFVVDRVADELTRVQLPRTLEAFRARAEGAP